MNLNISIAGSLRNQRARNRWLVTYTLINNPSLVPLRASQMEAGAEGEVGGQGAEPERPMNDYEPTVQYPALSEC